MSNKSVAKSQARVLPPTFRYVTEALFVFRPTKMERLKIAMGFNVRLTCTTQHEHQIGKRQHFLDHEVVNKL